MDREQTEMRVQVDRRHRNIAKGALVTSLSMADTRQLQFATKMGSCGVDGCHPILSSSIKDNLHEFMCRGLSTGGLGLELRFVWSAGV
jgi:hypothetical protein